MPGAELDIARLDAYAAKLLQTGAAPALAVAVTDRDHTIAARTYGAASADALWQIGSIGKSATAVVALQLVEQGLLSLELPVADALPWFTVRGDDGTITLHHLLSHTSGLIGTSDLAPASSYDVIALAETELGFPPGRHRLYSNIGYRLVGRLLETVTATSYAELVQERVLDRLGMHQSTPAIVNDIRRRLAGGHVPFYDDRPWRPEHGLVPAAWIESADADGCLCCTPTDLALYLRALWNEDGGLLSPAMLRLMRSAMPRSRARTTATGSTSMATASATAATWSAMCPICGRTMTPGSARSALPTASMAPGRSSPRRLRSRTATSPPTPGRPALSRWSTTARLRVDGGPTWAGIGPTTRGSRPS